MVILRSKIPDIDIPTVGIYQFIYPDEKNVSDDKNDKTVFIDGLTDKKLTLNELKSNSKKFAAGLQDKINFKRGDVLSIFSPNQVDYVTVIFGTIAAGGVVSPANPTYTVEEYTFQLKDSGSSVIVTHPLFLQVAVKAATAAKIPESNIFLFGDEKINEILPYTSLFGDREAIPLEYTPEEVKNTTAYICYSSGTSGKQKGVETTHYNAVANVLQISKVEIETNSDMVYVGVLPFYHIYALTVNMHFTLYFRASCVVISKFDFEPFCRIIQDYKVTITHIVPPIILALVKNPKAKEYDFSSLQLVISGAAPLSKELSESFYKEHKIKIKQGYGLTETSPVALLGYTNDSTPGCCGILLPNLECKLINEDGQEVGYNTPGELCLRGPNIMKGYLNNKQATDESIDKDGFFHTGDIVKVDENGYFYVVDRVKELIKYKGFQVAPAELEAILITHPAISDAAVIGVYSEEDATEYPVAYVVTKQKSQRTNEFSGEIRKFVDNQVAPHKKLRGGVIYIDQIPKSAAGKILRKKLRENHQN
ncbi:acetyl-CoA synthetase-like protein [Rhizophagus irregularis]|nr:acetyl-CoA synthetase-like protein [Rhizophagus irregularis]